ncbi:MAG: site-2 protease family protein [Nitriliruptorales bacterium]
MFGHSWRLGRIRGIEIRIDSSWAIIALLVTYSFYLQFTLTYSNLSPGWAIALAATTAVLFFGSVLTHEMAHALLAQRRGIRVRDITLFLFGGATRANVESRAPKDEFLISIVGPATSFILGAVLVGVGLLARGTLALPVFGALQYLGVLNLLLGVFNLIPGLPLDGGRVLRSALWKGTGSLDRATRTASLVGQAFGYLMMLVGLLLLFTGALANGIWLAAIGWFLAGAARSSYLQIHMHHLLEGVRAEDVMSPGLVAVPADASLREAVDEYFLRYEQAAFPVDEGGRTLGLLNLEAVKRIPARQWESRWVRDLTQPLDSQVTISPETPAESVVERLEEDGSPVFVGSDGHLIGEITPLQVGRYLSRRRVMAV